MRSRKHYFTGVVVLICIVLILLLTYLLIGRIVDVFRGENTVSTETVLAYIEQTNAIESLNQLVLAQRDFDATISTSNVSTTTVLGFELSSAEAREVHFNALAYYALDADRVLWDFQLSNGILYVSVPPIKPLRTAIDTRSIRLKINNNWAHFSAAQSSSQLLEQLSLHADINAAKPRNIDLVRETVRSSLGRVIFGWLPPEYGIRDIRIRFADEPAFLVLPDNPEWRGVIPDTML